MRSLLRIMPIVIAMLALGRLILIAAPSSLPYYSILHLPSLCVIPPPAIDSLPEICGSADVSAKYHLAASHLLSEGVQGEDKKNDSADTMPNISSVNISTSALPNSVAIIQHSERPFRYTFDGSPIRKTTQIDVGKALLYGGGYALAIGAAQYYQYQAFWADRLSFRIIDDGDLELGADKGGHMFAGYFMSKFSTDVLLTSGFSEDIATIGGGLMGLGYQFFVEVQDGYGNGWGFSPSDMIANTIGAGLHIAQRYVPGLQYVKMKAEFYPAPWFGEKTRKGASTPIDDYSAWTWWLSLDVHGILPEVAKPYWPSWLNIAFGYASRNLEWGGEQSRRYIISLDYDLEKLLPDGVPFWNWLRQYLNILKLPAPALEFGVFDDGKGNIRPMPVRAYLVFPFKIPF